MRSAGRSNKLEGVVDDEIEEDVKATERALDPSAALDVDDDLFVEVSLQLWLRDSGHLVRAAGM